jgi:hypothetical protein
MPTPSAAEVEALLSVAASKTFAATRLRALLLVFVDCGLCASETRGAVATWKCGDGSCLLSSHRAQFRPGAIPAGKALAQNATVPCQGASLRVLMGSSGSRGRSSSARG